MARYICVHGHFYQPPRENPWLEEIELQDSAHPYHDWNSRITAECYGPNTAARILTAEGRIVDIVNNYARISFNFGPTILSWMQRHEPAVYRAILDADKKSQEHFGGHGAALAQVYNHIIMPLANSRDKRTQVLWGIEDFRHRFQRFPEGMWLAETAVDTETLELLAQQKIRFTVLSPHQARRVRLIGAEAWSDVTGAKINPRVPYICRLPSGRSIALFFYDGPVAHQVAFGDLLQSGERLAEALLNAFPAGTQEELVHIATDGETFGHHHRFGDMALAYCLHYLQERRLAKVTIYGEYLDRHPPQYEVEIIENSSWSCFHGIERWRSDCGCSAGIPGNWQQKWRQPLRQALDWLRDNLDYIFTERGKLLFKDPWVARDAYIQAILGGSRAAREECLRSCALKELSVAESVQALQLLEMQRQSLLMYTSCGWFFGELSGIETVQIIAYAARAIQLAKLSSGVSFEEAFQGLLEHAPSNIPELKNGAVIYERFIRPQILDLVRVGVHYAVSSLFAEGEAVPCLRAYALNPQSYRRHASGEQRLAVGTVRVRSQVTWEEATVSFAVLHCKDRAVRGGAGLFPGADAFAAFERDILEAFQKGDEQAVSQLIERVLGAHRFELWQLFRDEQRRVINQIFAVARAETEGAFRQIYQRHHALIRAAESTNVPFPKYLRAVVTFLLNTDLSACFDSDEFDPARLEELAQEARRFPVELEKQTLSFLASRKVNRAVEHFFNAGGVDAPLLENMVGFLKVLEGFGLDLNLWKAQNLFFSLHKKCLEERRQSAVARGEDIGRWLAAFIKLGEYLKVKVD